MGNTCVYGDPVHEKLLEQVRELQSQVRSLEEELAYWKQRATGNIQSGNNSPPPPHQQPPQQSQQQQTLAPLSHTQQHPAAHYALPPTGPPIAPELGRASGLVKLESTPPYSYPYPDGANSAGPSSQTSTPQIGHHSQLGQPHLAYELPSRASHPGTPRHSQQALPPSSHAAQPAQQQHMHSQGHSRQSSIADMYGLNQNAHPGFYHLAQDPSGGPPQQGTPGIYTPTHAAHQQHYNPANPHTDLSKGGPPPHEMMAHLTQQEAEALYGEQYASQFRPRSA